MTRALRIAIPKGRMWSEVAGLFERIGAPVTGGGADDRRLIIPSVCGRFHLLPVKSMDVPVYVESGVADAGVVGLDVLRERAADVLWPLDLGFGRCRLAVAAPRATPYPHLPHGKTPRVATKYVETTRRFFANRGMQVELIRISGSVEVAPLLGLSDWIVDLVETGRTLAENGLVVTDEIAESTARWVVNRASHKLRLDEHQRLIGELNEGLSSSGTGSAA